MQVEDRERGSEWRGKRVCVLGFARSGLGAARLLLSHGARVRVLERALREELRAGWEELATAGAEMVAGPHPANSLDDCALVVRSPGVPADAPLLVDARRRGLPIISELQLAASEITTPLLAVTGTNGKSTTTAWTTHLLARAGVRAVAAGNIGRALSQAVLDEPPETVFVAEVSSFQLEDSPGLHPRAAAILNIEPDHLDRHGSFAAYAAAKWSIAVQQGKGDLLVLGAGLTPPVEIRTRVPIIRFAPEDPGGADAVFAAGGTIKLRRAGHETSLADASELSLPGPHNLQNAMASLALASAVVGDARLLVPGLRDFPGLPHRLEDAGRIDGVRFVNDSKATNVDSLRVALQSFAEPLVLIAGGLDKGGPFESLADDVRRRVRHLITIGKAADRIRSAWPGIPAEKASTLEEAIRLAWKAAGNDAVVLLSPGCASFDMFRDYEDRGDQFKAIVTALIAEASGARTEGGR